MNFHNLWEKWDQEIMINQLEQQLVLNNQIKVIYYIYLDVFERMRYFVNNIGSTNLNKSSS